MKVRESGIPEEACWEQFFSPEAMMDAFIGAEGIKGNLIEFGSGYGTFTIPAAPRTEGVVTAQDIDPLMVERVSERAKLQGLTNVRAEVRDFVSHGTGLDASSQAHAMIFNLLHIEEPMILLQEAHRILQSGGMISIIHWRSDIPTPRGPSYDIRPRPEQCQEWLEQAGFVNVQAVDLQAFCPYHFGQIAIR